MCDNFVLDLYKYYTPKYKGEYNLSFYTQRAVYFQKPVKFNDPWNCKSPEISIPRQINQLKDIWFHWGLQESEEFARNEWEKIKIKSRPEIRQLFSSLFMVELENQRSEIGVFHYHLFLIVNLCGRIMENHTQDICCIFRLT